VPFGRGSGRFGEARQYAGDGQADACGGASAEDILLKPSCGGKLRSIPDVKSVQRTTFLANPHLDWQGRRPPFCLCVS
jgi:hypothetical protein